MNSAFAETATYLRSPNDTPRLSRVAHACAEVGKATFGRTIFQRDYYAVNGEHVTTPVRGGMGQFILPATWASATPDGRTITRPHIVTRSGMQNKGVFVDIGFAIGALAGTLVALASGEPAGQTLVAAGTLWTARNAGVGAYLQIKRWRNRR